MNDLELYFRFKCLKGLRKRGLDNLEEYKTRLEYEIKTILSMGFPGYFLIVQDIIQFALKNGIPVGPGRGSAGGSLAAYCLEITHLDPIKYGLIFERFLNPDRVSMPDIDMDFCEVRREEIIKYVMDKYGIDKVAHIGTYGSMKAKAAIREATRVLGYEYQLGDKLAKMTLEPIEGKPQPLKTCYEKVPELGNLRAGEDCPEKQILSWAEKIENRIRAFGTHASGVVISQTPIAETIPLYPGKDGTPTTQFEMYTVEKCGLIKFDFLGLRALTTIQRCVDMIAERGGPRIDPLEIPTDDQPTYKILQGGDVDGVFQLEGSSGIRDLTVKIRPADLEDIATICALYRPGPLQSTELPHYLQVRAGETTTSMLHPDLEPILGVTDGMLIYQEQILEICKQLAGYTMGQADLMRRAVGKKKQELMDIEKPKFFGGMKERGYEESLAKRLWEDIEVFAGYGFNKSHAVCYGYISYQMAYLKTHYPLEFICSCLISDSDEEDKVIKYINYCKTQNIQVLPPSINESGYNFTIAGGDIRFGLGTIKNIGKPIQDVIQERKDNGPFKDIIDFSNRVDLSKVNSRKMESLVLAGAFDDFGHNRASLMGAVENIYTYKTEKKKYESKLNTYTNKIEFYNKRQKEIQEWNALSKEEQKLARQEGKKKPGQVKQPVKPETPEEPSIPSLANMSRKEKLSHEKELLGFYISGHPLDNIKEWAWNTIAQIKDRGQHKQKVSIIAIPASIQERTTKKSKKKMGYAVLEDKTGTIDSIILSNIYGKYKDSLDITKPAKYGAIIELAENDQGRSIKLIINSIEELEQEEEKQRVKLTIPASIAEKAVKVIMEHTGNDFISDIEVEAQKTTWKIGQFHCKGSPEDLLKTIEEIS